MSFAYEKVILDYEIPTFFFEVFSFSGSDVGLGVFPIVKKSGIIGQDSLSWGKPD